MHTQDTISKMKYKKNAVQLGSGQVMDFASDQITLDIPEEGINDLNGWNLSPIKTAVVSLALL